ncbi:MAG TPA: RpiB/LacA/LacB family sugar-phosphate isomerase [Patescibacteria group bacterium]|nr:RpiB/LacA/LacB family sugar-phosphate isomerase [Patescibacteria group bacterium]
MKIYLGADHRGFALKTHIQETLGGHEVVDLGAMTQQPQDDFVDYALLVGQKVASENDAYGVLVCGSGAGMCIAANKIAGIRCGVGHTVEEVRAMRHDDNINILALPADFITQDKAVELVKVFLQTPFAPEERFVRRIAKIKELENHA